MRFKRIKRKRYVLITALFFSLMVISFLGFAFDISRVMYMKMYTRNLASAIAISIVNETSYAYHDVNSGARSILIYSDAVVPLKYFDKYGTNTYKGKYANNQYAKTLANMNKGGMDKGYSISKITLNGNNTDRFIIGADGKNGEVEVVINARMKFFFLNGGGYHYLQEEATAQAYASATGVVFEQDDQKSENWNIIR